MAKYILVTIETGFHTGQEPVVVELDDEASVDDCEEAAREEFFNQCGYSWTPCDEEGGDL